ncbi:Dual specificity phosphatase [Corchorus olitorius]|uniref:protein-tyrosine-phosphatase n=1 Tax=Corchorus olitorius TaxID=93759 RepID=A0A1R3KKZ6_9ROSI|nr:Dual specificity phosphatase [Corchorus olitorius]
MGHKVDHTSPIYKRFRLKVLGDCYNRGEKIDSSKLGADPGLPTESSSVIKASPDEGINRTAYRCKKCRRVVALQANVVDHIPGEGIQCSCGSWITPAFQLHKSRVDISTV